MTTKNIIYLHNKEKRRGLVISMSLLGTLLIADQLLLPMFHTGDIPFKISYLFLVLWGLHWLRQCNINNTGNSDFLYFFMIIFVITISALLGELYFSAISSTGSSHTELIRSVTMYLLYMLAFGLGLQNTRFNLTWLVKIFYIAVILNLIFIFLREQTPAWLVNIYYDERSINNAVGFESVNSIMSLMRPRGLFGNPNISALMVNINVLFIYLAFRNNLLMVKSHSIRLGIIVLPILLVALFGSRAEFLVSIILGMLNYRLFYKTLSYKGRIYLILSSVVTAIIVALIFFSITNIKINKYSIERISLLSKMASGSGSLDSTTDGSERILLFDKAGAIDRYLHSPIFGTGYGSGSYYPFDHETRYFHNDWARLLVTSGVLGILAMMYLVWRFAWPLGWPVLIPFFIPGLVNSFMLCIPASIFYWLMVGILREKTSLLKK